MKLLIAVVLSALYAFAAVADDAVLTDWEQVVSNSASGTVLGPVGGSGDVLARLLLIPETTSPGTVYLQESNGVSMSIFNGGASSVNELRPMVIEVNARSVTGSWKVYTGNAIHVIGVGRFK